MGLDRQEKLLQKHVDLEQTRHDTANALAEMEETQLKAQNLANLEAIRKAQLQANWKTRGLFRANMSGGRDAMVSDFLWGDDYSGEGLGWLKNIYKTC